jgi:hypothetical protein
VEFRNSRNECEIEKKKLPHRYTCLKKPYSFLRQFLVSCNATKPLIVTTKSAPVTKKGSVKSVKKTADAKPMGKKESNSRAR